LPLDLLALPDAVRIFALRYPAFGSGLPNALKSPTTSDLLSSAQSRRAAHEVFTNDRSQISDLR